MNEQWQVLSARFAALQQREKYLVVGAALVGIVFVGYSVLVEPAMKRKAKAATLVSSYTNDIATMGPQVDVLRAQLKDPDAPVRKGLVDVRKQLTELDKKFGEFDRVLVAPEKMPVLLQSLLSRHRGLEMVSVKTLPPEPVIHREEGKAGNKEAEPAQKSSTETGNIYKHGLEIRIAGGYQDLLGYVAEIEQGPQRLLMGSMTLEVKKHPRVELTLVVYSLSLERTWLVV